MNFQHFFNEKKHLIETWLDSTLANDDPDVAGLVSSARYSALLGGKRFRGVIVLMMADWLGETRSMLSLAGAAEMIHAYSLIHDDLPAMDDDDLRRGKPTNHIVYGEAMAILAGDYLLSDGHRLMVEGLCKAGFEPDRILEVTQYLGDALGKAGMVGGQVMDMTLTGKKIGIAQLKKVHCLKTGRFIEFAVVAPVILSKGVRTPQENIDLCSFALKLGLLFQIMDDILDVTADETILGKPVGSDQDNQKATYVSVLGLEKAKEASADLQKELLDSLVSLRDTKLRDGLTEWVRRVVDRDQ